eukprot:CAMPEP_0177738330 /NCGR_PEP_ID=MMETSP0484_2-20121128/26395_1 /TAXON_ID=354590 /ORGANISM="Rhodomonas lens, Strain RHODO" /LENGTH=124 /DNA_ID=CAMNT_0019252239 /DNA_START=83 /DNA_END=454 /DNA_ORIENTATION=-
MVVETDRRNGLPPPNTKKGDPNAPRQSHAAILSKGSKKGTRLQELLKSVGEYSKTKEIDKAWAVKENLEAEGYTTPVQFYMQILNLSVEVDRPDVFDKLMAELKAQKVDMPEAGYTAAVRMHLR